MFEELTLKELEGTPCFVCGEPMWGFDYHRCLTPDCLAELIRLGLGRADRYPRTHNLCHPACHSGCCYECNPDLRATLPVALDAPNRRLRSTDGEPILTTPERKSPMPDKPIADVLKEGAARLEEGQVRVIVLGSVASAYHKSLFAPIIREEQLRSVQAAIALSLVAMYPSLLLEDPDPLLGAIELAVIVGLLAGSRHALAIPPELASLVQPMLEAQV